ncbi:MAG: 4-alpha-glucanotransferase [Vicinamibacterales bacterium]
MIGGRRSGVLLPLFSMRSAQSWGIGEFADLAGVARWLALAGQSFVQFLPINEMPPGERSPYSSMTAMALDPIFVAVPRVPDFAGIGGEAALEPSERSALESLREQAGLDYRGVRALKDQCLRRAWERFVRVEYARGSSRAARLDRFEAEEAWWLDEYALFRALSAHFADRAWWDWPEVIATRRPEALREALAVLDGEIRYRKYLQWLAADQWNEARRLAWPVRVFGDLPFMVSANSPDVWARQDQFRRDASVGVPPDAFSESGQDWGLPPWRWETMAATDFAWVRARATRSAAIYDGFRLDHLVGLYRTYVRPLDAQAPFFAPIDEPSQLALGETLVKIYQASGAEITAEDLGTVPDFVRDSLRHLEVPGYKVLRWERQWNEPGQPFIDPSAYPEIAVATPGTHDSETLAEWWTTLDDHDRAAVLGMPSIARELPDDAKLASRSTLPGPVLDAFIKALLTSRARIVILPMQDLFGWSDRINTPATVGETNWSWRMPWDAEGLMQEREPLERAALLLGWTRQADR